MTTTPPPSMIEKMARAICQIDHAGWSESYAESYRSKARAVLESMREPTDGIEDAARGLWLWYGGGRKSGWTIRKHNDAAGYGLSLTADEADIEHLPKHVCGRIAWRTMISAALEGK